MRKLFAVVALVAIASPAFAQTADHEQRAAKRAATDTRAPASTQNPRAHHSTNPAYDVYGRSGAYVGSDPDPQVRTVLQFDAANEGND
jgi:hypothetical protein